MRGLFMDFSEDPNVTDLRDEYMFGPAFLVAPVTSQGATSRRVYLPAGTDWFNYWTNEKIKGGQTINVSAPIDQIPLFVRAGSLVPLGEPIENTTQNQPLAQIRVYGGTDASFTLYNDDGQTYDYEKNNGTETRLHWNGRSKKLTHEGPAAWTKSETELIEIIGQ